MPKENIIPIENKKPIEIVAELKNEIPTFEEFMENYESDSNLNYADLESDDEGSRKGYGPCASSECNYRNVRFKIEVRLKDCHLTRDSAIKTLFWYHEGIGAFGFYNIDDARNLLKELEEGSTRVVSNFWGSEQEAKKNHLKRELRWVIREHEVGEEINIKESI